MFVYVFLILLLFAFLAFLYLMSERRSLGRAHFADDLRLIKNLHGAARCEKVCQTLEAALQRGNATAVVSLWQDLEGYLLQALPDCPPRLKPRLRAVLEGLHERCDHRATQRAVMDVRRSLSDDPRGLPEI